MSAAAADIRGFRTCYSVRRGNLRAERFENYAFRSGFGEAFQNGDQKDADKSCGTVVTSV